MVLGIERPTHMAKKTGLTFHTAKRWMQEIKDRWTSTLTEEEQNFRRELLYQEAESLARDAWATALGSNNPSVVVGAFKAILEANARRAGGRVQGWIRPQDAGLGGRSSGVSGMQEWAAGRLGF